MREVSRVMLIDLTRDDTMGPLQKQWERGVPRLWPLLLDFPGVYRLLVWELSAHTRKKCVELLPRRGDSATHTKPNSGDAKRKG